MKKTAIILAGGKSSRMGTNKALMQLNGKIMLDILHAEFAKTCDQVLISGSKDLYDDLKYKIVEDEIEDQGPAAGILSALKQSSTKINYICACDHPFASIELFNLLEQELSNADCCMPKYKGKLFPTLAVYNKRCSSIFDMHLNNDSRKLMEIVSDLNCNVIDLSDDDYNRLHPSFKNVNKPEEARVLNIY